MEEKGIKHYNGATAMGIIAKVEEKETEKKKAFLELLVDCPHPVHGTVRVLGRVWGEKNIKAFQAGFKQGSIARLQGVMQQYDGRNGERRSNFNFFQFFPGPLKEMKAVFVLVGEVEKYQDDPSTSSGCLTVRIVQEDGNGKITNEELIEVHVPGEVLLTTGEPEPGQQVRVKGYMTQEEDEFCQSEGPMRPVVKEMEIL